VVDSKLREERNPAVPNSLCNPPVVERRLGEERNPAVPNCLWSPPVVEIRLGEEIKSEVAICRWRPPVVDTRFKGETPPGPKAVENEEIARLNAFVVEIREDANERDEIYPAEPKPTVVEIKLLA
jgi:hypothetical protein